MKIKPVVIDERMAELDLLACRAHSIDEKQYPEMADLINRFLVLDPDDQDYRDLADQLMSADTSKCMPDEVVDFVKAAYECDIEKEDAMAANNLGALYYGGRIGGESDYEKAREYYEIADRLGYSLASENLAYIYYYGFGTEVDYEKAYLYFSKAALCGRYEATYKLGDMFRNGFYVEKSEKMTSYFYRRAMELVWQDNVSNNKYLGCVYQRVAALFYEGIGTAQDDAEAFRYYQLAEECYYTQIADGDKYHADQIPVVIERQKKLRKRIQKKLPKYEF